MLDGLAKFRQNINGPISKKERKSATQFLQLIYVLCDRELSQVEPNHLGLYLNLVEFLSGVNTNDGADHLGNDDHVTEVGLDEVGLLIRLCLLLGLTEFLDKAHRFALQTAVESPAGTSMNEVAELFRRKV